MWAYSHNSSIHYSTATSLTQAPLLQTLFSPAAGQGNCQRMARLGTHKKRMVRGPQSHVRQCVRSCATCSAWGTRQLLLLQVRLQRQLTQPLIRKGPGPALPLHLCSVVQQPLDLHPLASQAQASSPPSCCPLPCGVARWPVPPPWCL